MSREALKKIQQGLKELGYDPGPIDGFWGARTKAAIDQLSLNNGNPNQPALDFSELPWMVHARRVLGLHEARNNADLKAFLKSDGRTLGDPAVLPWCGDFVETCIRLGQPAEVFPGNLGANPYWARNWKLFGVDCEPTYGAVVVFERGPSSGHVGFLVGQDASAYHVLGGNQSNTVSVARISKGRMIGCRWPSTFPKRPTNLASVASGKLALSTNEA